MNTTVLRIDLTATDDIASAIQTACNAQLKKKFELKSSFVWEQSLILIFQKV